MRAKQKGLQNILHSVVGGRSSKTVVEVVVMATTIAMVVLVWYDYRKSATACIHICQIYCYVGLRSE